MHVSPTNGRAKHLPPPDTGDAWEPTDADDPRAPPKTKPPGQKPAVPSPIESAWLRLHDSPHLLIDQPPPQDWLLTRYVDRHTVGVLPRGKAGTLTSAGGVGKTYAMIQLAVAVATGGFWFDFRATQGHVLLALAEEDIAEVQRRLWRVCNALELSIDERRAVAERIDILPLAGVPVALTSLTGGTQIVTTPIYDDIRRLLTARGVEWALLVFDPLSRWAGGGVETNNEFATRFVQAVEALSDVPGKPTVLVVHHSSKASVRDGKNDARGVTGLTDGFRWRATLDAVRSENGARAVKLTNAKNNYAPQFDDLTLVRNEEPGKEGTLRVAQNDEVEAFRAQTTEDRASRKDHFTKARTLADARIVADVLTALPGIGIRQLRAEAKARAGIGVERVEAALAVLGEAVIRGVGANRLVPLSIDRSALPDDFSGET